MGSGASLNFLRYSFGEQPYCSLNEELKYLGADKVISVMFEESQNEECSKNLIEVAGRSIGLLCRELSNYEMEGSDFTLKINSRKIGLLDMKKIDELYELGYEQTKKNINKIKEILNLNKINEKNKKM